jgi:hypothetical protein
MRFLSRPLALCSITLTLSCTDGDPVYPDIPDFSNTGAQSTGATGTGATGTGDANTGATSNSGGHGNGGGGRNNSNAGTGGSNSPSTDPLYGHCDLPWSGEALQPAKPACDLDALIDGGELKGDISADRTLKRGHVYQLNGEVRIIAGKTLTIEPCVKVVGRDEGSVLVALSATNLGDEACSFSSGKPIQAAKIVAAGEPMAPIVFTSANQPGQRTPGDWGGVMLLGNGFHNDASKITRAATEGLVSTECYGWNTTEFNQESSGKLEYVRIEYASRQTGEGLETNGLTLAGVGSGTSMHHVMVANSNDDCFEFFGGAVNAHHLIALNCEDDMFDSDKGYSGHVQFAFGRQFRTTTEADSRGFEIDSGPGQPAGATTGKWSNFTICGGGPDDTKDSRNGLAFRAAAEASLMNGLVTGFAGGGLFISQDGETKISSTSVFDNLHGLLATAPGANSATADWFTSQPGNSGDNPGRFCDCWQPRPVAVAAERIEGEIPVGFEDPTANYRGAFEDASPDSNWMQGSWVDWSAN